jgi:hypothetical protein
MVRVSFEELFLHSHAFSGEFFSSHHDVTVRRLQFSRLIECLVK